MHEMSQTRVITEIPDNTRGLVSSLLTSASEVFGDLVE